MEESAAQVADALERLILPGTPDDVRAAYGSLARRTKEMSFGLVEETVIVLDTETTGLSFKDCELIEIAAARLEGSKITERFQTFVHPTGPIPANIVQLTGINDLDVADAPNAEEAVAALAEFVGGLPIVAHNANFDRTFVERVPGGKTVSKRWIDSLMLSRIALPRLSSHRLACMAEAFGCAGVTHRAMDDVDALCGMWRVLLCALSDLPAGLLALLADMHEEAAWSYRPLFSQLALAGKGSAFSLRDCRRSMLSERRIALKPDAMEKISTYDVPTREEILQEFTPQGLAGRMYEEFESRPDQLMMACEVRDALREGTHRALEAGTGVGKSLAYLIPEVLFAQRNNLTVGVATKTNALTDQLIAHELPLLARALPEGLSFMSLKGYDHYPCLLRLERAAHQELPVGEVRADGVSEQDICENMLNAVAVTYAFACQSPEGDLDSLGIHWRCVPRALLTTTPSECVKARCPFFPNECLVHGARRRAGASDVVVTNHSLLLRDASLGGNVLLPPIRHWVIDEAHGFEAEARRQWAEQLSAETIHAGFEHLGGTRSGVLKTLLTKTSQMEGSTLLAGLLTRLAASSARAQIATADLLEAIHGLGGLLKGSDGYDTTSLWLNGEVRDTPEWACVGELGLHAMDCLDECGRDAKSASEALAKQSPQMAADLDEAAQFIAATANAIGLIVPGEDDSFVYYAQLSRSRKRMGQEFLAAEKIDVGAAIAETWLPQVRSAVFTSATMAVGESFEHFNHAVGLDVLDPSEHSSLQLSSSFDFDQNMGVIVARNMPEPNNRDYLAALADLLYFVHVGMEGSVLTLFTNRREMESVYAQLKPRLEACGLDLACQERGSSPRRLRERFLAEESLSLMALRSFWEGFDAAGDTLRCVVVTKLPFASPNDPLSREREQRDQRAWWRYSLPEAVLTVKQAAGRLIRTERDTGLLVLADSRLLTKRYGRQFLSSLPSKSQYQLDVENIQRFIEMWRASRR